MKRRAISLILALAMLVSQLPTITIRSEAAVQSETMALAGTASNLYAQGAEFIHRSDGVWLFPLPPAKYNSFSDWAGCPGNGMCWFHSRPHTNENGSSWGDTDHTGKDKFGHNGFDNEAGAGTVVYAAAGGTASTFSDSVRGKTVVIEHPLQNGWSYYSYYQHLGSYANYSNPVSAGDPIGYVGSTGYSSGPHLHFGIVLGESGRPRSAATLNELEGCGWVKESGFHKGRILDNPAFNSPAGFPNGRSDVVPPLRAHAGSVMYTFNKNDVSIGEKQFRYLDKQECALNLTTKTTCNLWSMPGNTSTYPDSVNYSDIIGKIPAGTKLTATCIYQNTANGKHYWYEVKFKGTGETETLGYVYSEYINADKTTLIKPTVDGAKVDNISTDTYFDVNGTLNAHGCIIKSAEGHLFNGNTGYSTTGSEAVPKSVMNNVNQLTLDLKSSVINTGLKFEKLASGKQYTLSIIATAANHYIDKNNELVTKSDPVCAFSYSFYRGTAPVSTTYTVSLVPGAGTCGQTSFTYNKGEKLGTLPPASLDGYYFDDWYSAQFGGNEATETMPVNSNMTLFAHYTNENNYAAKIAFDPNGGVLGGIVNTETVSGYNRSRGAAELIVYNKAGTKPNTNEYGYEIAVDASGHVIAKREYGSTTQLTVPSGGFILSGHGGGSSVHSIIALPDAYVRVNYETGKVYVYDSYDSYLADGTYLWEYSWFTELPIPKWDGHYFAGWYSDSYGTNRIVYHSGFSGANCVARWDNSPQPKAELSYGGHFYQVYDYNMSWTEAKALCESLGGHLVTITSQAEQNQILALAQQCDMGQYYIGVSDAEKEGDWKWVTGEAFSYKNWDTAYPEPNGGTAENYATMITRDNPPNKEAGEWVDTTNICRGGFYDCSYTGFICEYERPSLCEHTYQYSVNAEPTLSSGGWITGRCANCGDTTQIALPALNKTDYQYTRIKAPSCDEFGQDQYRWSNSEIGSFTFSVQIAKTEHQYQSVTTPPSCSDYGYTTYTCSVCGNSYITYQNSEWSEWSEVFPVGIDPSMVESKQQYRYADYETVTSTEPTLSGYEQVSSSWVQKNSGTIQYVTSWPGGFDKSNSLYTTYNNTPKTASETQTSKTVVNSETAGYIYYHWCRGTYTGGPINRATNQSKTSEFKSFHAFFNANSASRYDKNGTDGDPSRYFPNGSVCKDSYWYYPITVYRQSYTEYQKQFVYGRWGAWSAWSDTPAAASDSRNVETRTLYRYAVAPTGSHSWDNGTITKATTCTVDGIRTFTCTACGETQTEIIPAPGHKYQKTTIAPSCTDEGYTKYVCSVCSHTYTENVIIPRGHTWDNGVVTTQPGPGTLGVRTFTCTVCSATKTESIAALPITYMVSYNANGGDSAPNAQTKIQGVPLTLSDFIPARAGHSFLGWAESSTAAAAAYAPGVSFPQDKNVTLYAVWKIHTYTVSYDPNGGTGAPASQTKTYGQPLTLRSEVPSKTGHDFLGWAETSDAQTVQYPTGGSYQTDSDIVLYAVWAPSEYTVTYNPNGGIVNPGTRNIHYGEKFGPLPVPERYGYDFIGWYSAANDGEVIIPEDCFRQTNNLHVYAHWKANTYTITYSANGGNAFSESQIKTHDIPLVLTSSEPTRTGYTFLGWALDEKATSPDYCREDTYLREGDTILYAVWQAVTVTVSFNPNGGSVDTTSKTLSYGSAFGALPEPTRDGWSFIGWFTSKTNGSPVSESSIVEYTGNFTLYAFWANDLLSGSCGDNIQWTLDLDTGLLSLSGSGAMTDFPCTTIGYYLKVNSPWFDYRGSVKKVEISSGITSVGDYAFSNCTQLSEISIPETVSTIGKYAFYHCDALDILLPRTITVIKASAFEKSGMTQLRVYQEMSEIGDSAFRNSKLSNLTFEEGTTVALASGPYGCFCENALLESVEIPGTIHLGNHAFSKCTGLKRVVFGEGITNIGVTLNECSNIEKLVVPASMTNCGVGCFYGLRKLRSAGPIGSGCDFEYGWDTQIPDYAFYGCFGIESIVFPDTITHFGYNAFLYTKIKDFTVPKSLSSIYKNCFPTGMKNCYVENGNTVFTDVDGVLFTADMTTLWVYPGGRSDSVYIVPEGVTKIQQYAFSRAQIKRIVFPASLRTIDEYAFYFSSLEEVDVPGYVEVGGWAFWRNESLHMVKLSEGITVVSPRAFYLNNTASDLEVYLPKSVTYIGADAFGTVLIKYAGSEEDYNNITVIDGTLATNRQVIYNNTDRMVNVRFHDGTENGLIDGIIVPFGMPYGILPEVTRKGFDFLGWFTEPNGGDLITSDSIVSNGDTHTLYAQWTPNTYVISFDSNGGLGDFNPISKQFGATIILPDVTPTRKGYTFLGWADQVNAEQPQYQAGSGFVVNAEQTLYAVWDANSYTLSLDTAGGTVNPPTKTVTFGQVYGALPVPVRGGHTFEGWFLADGTQITEESNVETAGQHIATAHWTVETYSVSYDANGGVGAPDAEVKTYGQTLTLSTTVPARTGYRFLGWATSAEATEAVYQPSASYTQNNGLSLYAVWEKILYVVALELNDGTSPSQQRALTYGDPYGLLPAVERQGYAFGGWYHENGEAVTAETPMLTAANHTLTAKWNALEWTLSFDANGGSNAPEQITCKTGEAISVPDNVPVNAGYRFLGWALTADAVAAQYQPGDSLQLLDDLTLNAVWQAEHYTVTFDADGGTLPFTSKSVLFGQPYGELPTPTMENNEFLGWYTAADEGTAITAEDLVQITENQTFYARWAIDTHLLRFDANSGHAEMSTMRFAIGEALGDLPEAQKEGNQFTGWFTAPENGQEMNASAAFNFKEDAEAFAHWSPEEYTIRYDTGNATRAPAPTQTKYHGTDITLSEVVPQREGYVFTGWAFSPFAEIAEYSDGDLFTLDRNATLYAIWAEKAPISFTQMPENASALPGETVRFAVEAEGENLVYQWEISTDYGWTWTPVDSQDADTNQLTIVMRAEDHETCFRCVVTDDAQNVAASDSAKLTLPPSEAVIVTQPQDYAGHMGDTAEFIVEAEGSNLMYQWYYSADAGDTWIEADSQSASVGVTLNEENYGRLYRCEITDRYGIAAHSEYAVLGLASSDIIITEQPESIFGEEIQTGSFHVTAEAENLTYQWLYSSDFGETWSPWPEEDGSTDTISIELTEDIKHYLFKCFLESGRTIACFSDIVGFVGYGVNQPDGPSGNPFIDVTEGSYYYDPVLWAFYHDPQITVGTSETEFSPHRACTRSQIATFIWRANGCPTPTGEGIPFADVAPGTYYYTAVQWAYEQGITTGTSASAFSPNRACTRAEAVTLLWRSLGSPAPSQTTTEFTDVPTSRWYSNAVLWAVEKGITVGTSETTFSPYRICSRAQIVTFLYRAFNGSN